MHLYIKHTSIST